MTDIPRLSCPRMPVGGAASLADPIVLRENLTGATPRQGTRVSAAWDELAWHVRFEADAVAPWATLTERDSAIWTEEVVEVFLDPIGDLASYFEIEINPLGTVTDLILRRVSSGWRKDFAWHADGLISRVQRTVGGWTAELSLPFAALGAAAAARPGKEWRVNFLRIDRPGGPSSPERELSAWSPTGLVNFHRPERFGMMEFVD